METLSSYAVEVASRSTCPSRPCGAVLELDSGDIVTGYEGAPRGCGHCSVIGCFGDPCQRAIRAELNVIIEAARRGLSTVGATLYVSTSLHPSAVGAVVNAGVLSVVCVQPVAPSLHQQLLDAGLNLVQP